MRLMYDLHGNSVDEAKLTVQHAIAKAFKNHIQEIRFVTGRGKHRNKSGERGILFKSFQSWVDESPFRQYIENCTKHVGFYEIKINTRYQNDASIQKLVESSVKDMLPFFKKMSDGGNPHFQILYAKTLRELTNAKKQQKTIFNLFKGAAQEGIPEATFELGCCYYHGVGVHQSDALAFQHYKDAAQKNHVRGIMQVADFYWNGRFVEHNERTALSYYSRAAALGSSEAMRKIASAYKTAGGIDQDLQKSFYWYQRAAELDDSLAQYNVAVMAMHGRGTKQNNAVAQKFLHLSAENGDPDAAQMLSILYFNGRFNGLIIDKDPDKGRKWLQVAASNGSIQANLDLYYDCEESSRRLQYLERAAQLGSPTAKCLLYKQNRAAGTPKAQVNREINLIFQSSYELSSAEIVTMGTQDRFKLLDHMLMSKKQYYRRKAFDIYNDMWAEGCPIAGRRLIRIFTGGDGILGIKKNIPKVIELLKQSTELGCSKACMNLAIRYHQGLDVKQSIERTLHYAKKASNLHNPCAHYFLATLYLFDEQVTSPSDTRVEELLRLAIKDDEYIRVLELDTGFLDHYQSTNSKAQELLNALLHQRYDAGRQTAVPTALSIFEERHADISGPEPVSDNRHDDNDETEEREQTPAQPLTQHSDEPSDGSAYDAYYSSCLLL